MKTLKMIWNWLVLSSANPSAYSLSLKAALTLGVTYVTMALNFGHIVLPSDLLTQLVDGIIMFVQAFLTLVSIVFGIYGIIRKIWSTIKGTNQVVNG